jgi:hypothetical protein
MPVSGMSNAELLEVMRRLAYPIKDQGEHESIVGSGAMKGTTLREFCEDRAHMGPFIVNVTGHYVAVSRGMICDTFTKEPKPWSEYPKLRTRVQRWWKFPELTSEEAAVTASKIERAEVAKPPKPDKPKRDIKQERYKRTLVSIKAWKQN